MNENINDEWQNASGYWGTPAESLNLSLKNKTNDELAPILHQYGMQSEEEIKFLLNIADEVKPEKVLEIGTGSGATTMCFAVKDADVVTVDVFTDNPVYPWQTHGYENKVRLYTGDSRSHKIYNLVEGKYDVILIDGDHSWEGGMADWVNYSPMAPIVGIHDIGQYDSMIDHNEDWFPRRFWRNIKQQNFETSEINPSPPLGGGWGFVFK